ncbi:MAG: transcriptional regulator [Candidatus Lokiarchaeota archaeon]|nr:transcriptional regulator [Candidatus Lokiarchaeota archaeon]
MSEWKTRRERIIELLKESYYPMDLDDIAYQLEEFNKQKILEDIHHINKSLSNTPYRLLIKPPMCEYCGFVFDNKLNMPSKCPKCKKSLILPPKFQIEEK